MKIRTGTIEKLMVSGIIPHEVGKFLAKVSLQHHRVALPITGSIRIPKLLPTPTPRCDPRAEFKSADLICRYGARIVALDQTIKSRLRTEGLPSRPCHLPWWMLDNGGAATSLA
jgi:hypothetical protein